MAENTEKRKRTRQKLADALVELCGEKNYYDITVWDICQRAGVYRSTFYRYYDTKDEMLREIEHEYVRMTQSLTKSLNDFRADAPPEKMELFRKELTADMEYHRQNEKLCRFLLSPAGDLYFYQKLVESLGSTARNNLLKNGKHHSGQKTDYMVTYFAAGFVAVIQEWLLRNDCTPEDIASFLLDMLCRFYR
ncbi:MAG: TetR/AcrR family transcriptional regulator [Solobacterium sp.]|nr:TetR/AcrR family transcriptional regulator [Solobacterium sp.]